MNHFNKLTPLSVKMSDFAETGLEVAQLLMSKQYLILILTIYINYVILIIRYLLD